MKEDVEIEIDFTIILQPLDTMLNLVYENRIKVAVNSHFVTYQEDILKTESAKTEIKNLITDNSKYILSLLSKEYRNRLLQFYSQEGLVYYIYVHTNQLTMAYLEELINSKS